MTVARKDIVDPRFATYYQVTGRCVRRAHLCGEDRYSGKCYEHRRQWIIDRITLLSKAFAIDVAAYSILTNHYHMVVRLDPDRAKQWTDEEVMDRWSKVYAIPEWIRELDPDDTDRQSAFLTWIKVRRQYLTDLSWFMKCLNEYIAKAANEEDECTGAFWQGRFHSRALLSDKAVIGSMAYVDLNLVRAKMAATPEDSDFTSFQQRMQEEANKILSNRPALLPFRRANEQCKEHKMALPLTAYAYMQLIDATGRVLAHGKNGKIPSDALPILERLGFDEKGWLTAARFFGRSQYRVIGSVDEMRVMATTLRKKKRGWYAGHHEVGQALAPPH